MQKSGRTSQRASGGHRRGRVELGRTETRRLIQLGVSVALFLAVFLGKGILPGKLGEATEALRQALHTDTDFVAAFSAAGKSLGNGAPVLDTLGDFCVAVFGAEMPTEGPAPTATEPEPTETPHPTETVGPENGNSATAALQSTTTVGNDGAVVPLRYVLNRSSIRTIALDQTEPVESAATDAPVEEAPIVLPVGTVVQTASYSGEALPENVSMACLSLGGLKTQDPIQGVLTSSFSYRVHPIDGVYRFHYGTDLAADLGTPIGAFADGVVDFVGESEGYGLYVQLDHGSGIKSFYAHCSMICVKDGQRVSMGEKIAEVGETGYATGPHLHFQIKVNNTWLDPAYYLSALS